MKDHSHTALIVVDNQVGAIESKFWGTERSNPLYEQNVASLVAAFRSLETAHVIHIYHSSLNPESPLFPNTPGIAFHPSSSPVNGEVVIGKSMNSAFVDSNLEKLLKDLEIRKVYFIGLSIDLCLGSTIRGASDLKIGQRVDTNRKVEKGEIFLVSDGTAAWAKHDGKFDAETVHGVHLESIGREFASILSTAEVLRELGYKGAD